MQGWWSAGEIRDARSVDVAVATVIVIGVIDNEGVGSIKDAAAPVIVIVVVETQGW